MAIIKTYRVAVVGATGLVGQEIVRLLEQRGFPVAELRLYASDRSAGKKLFWNHRQLEVKETDNHSFRETDIALFATGAEVSRYFSTIAARAGAAVVDGSPAFRMVMGVPLIVPEANADDLKKHQGIIASPNCTTVPLVTALSPLHRENRIKRLVITTFQAVSGMGSPAIEELTTQAKLVLEGKTTTPHVFPHQIAFNLLPEVDVFLDNGYTKEEWTLVEETRKILHDEDIMVSATCVRVPVLVGHSIAVNIEFEKNMPADEARSILSRSAGLRVLDDVSISLYPQPWALAGTDDVCVGRIRRDESYPSGLVLWIVSDNTRKGTALNIVQIAEELIKRDLIKHRG